MNTVVEYVLVGDSNILNFESEVMRFIGQGWQPLGGICVDNDCYHQAMVRYRKEEPKPTTQQKRLSKGTT